MMSKEKATLFIIIIEEELTVYFTAFNTILTLMLFEHTRSAILATSIIELISLLHSSKVRRLFFPNNKERKVN